MCIRAILIATAACAIVVGGVGLAIAANGPATPTSGGTPAATAPVPAAAAAPQAPAATAHPAATAAPIPASPPQSAAKLTQPQLDQLVAPIALYPDQLLDQVLTASTYPLEVVEAARWVKAPAHQRLKGDALLAVLKQQQWDPSVMALVPFPRVLDVMSERLQWTEAVGNAFLAQQADVLAAVQQLRHDAMQAGNLTPARCHCNIATSAGAISIAPANPAEVYVPVCNPQYVYGPWPYPAYPPILLPLPIGYVWGPVPFIGFYPFVTVAWYGPLWGWAYFDWWHANIIVNPAAVLAAAIGDPAFHRGIWMHDPAHRDGVPYASASVAGRFGGRAAQAAAANGRFADPTRGAAAATAGATTAHSASAAAAAATPAHGASAASRYHGSVAAHTAGVHRATAAHGGFRGTAAARGAFHAAPHMAARAAPHAAFHAAPHTAAHAAPHMAAHAAPHGGGGAHGGHGHG